MGLDVGVEARGGGRVAGPVTSDGQLPGQVDNRSKCRDQQIVSLVRHHRSDRDKSNNGVVTAKRRRDGIITGSHDPDALRLDAVISDHDPPGCLARDHDAGGSGQRGALARAENVRLRGVETGFQSKRLVHQRDERRAGSERAGLGQRAEGKPIEDNRPPGTAASITSAVVRCTPLGNGKPSPRSRISTCQPSRRSSWMMRRS